MNLDTANPVQPTPVALYWRLDKTGRLTPEEVLSPAQQSFFTPFPPVEISRAAGTSWFRFSIAPYGGKNGPYYLDLNTKVAAQIPKGHRVWLLREGQPHIQLQTDTPGLYLLPDSTLPATIYVRTEGLPAVGFAPVLRSAATLTVLDTDGAFWIGIVLAVALLLGLLRGIFEQREWRMWAALYAGTLLVANAWGFPATPDGKVLLLDLPGLLAPGIALLLLPHVGRHILRSREHSSILDIQFILIGLIGLVLCLLPLLSNHVWTIRYLPLWPLGMLLLLPTTLQALFQKINGAGRFLSICLLPPLGLLSFAPLPLMQFTSAEDAGLWTSLVSLLPSLCLCASSLLIALAPTPKHEVKTKRVPTPGAGLEMPGKAGASSPLRLEPVASPTIAAPPLVLDDASRMTPPANVDSALPLHNLERRMRGPLDVLLNEIGTLEQMNLPRDLVDHAHRLSRAGRQLSLLIGEISSGRHISPVAIRQKSGMEAAAQSHAAPFDLYDVILQAHNAVAELAEAKNLALSWFTAPHLARTYNGQGERLLRVLTLLAESAVHATDRGIVQIRVQRLPESNDPGLLLFTVSDTGKGAPPLQRSSISLVQVWELVGPTGGTLNVESGPTGTSIAFSMRFQALSAESASRSLRDAASPGLRSEMCNALRILVISDVPGSRQLLCYYLDELPHEVREARSVDEALGMYTQAPGALLIFDGDLPENDVVRTIAAIRAFEGENGYPLASILALVKDDEQIERLRRAGCTHSLLKPVSRTELRQLALRLAPIPRSRAPHKPEPAAPVAPQSTASQSTVSQPPEKKTARPAPVEQPRKTTEIKRRPWSLLSMGSADTTPEVSRSDVMPTPRPTSPTNVSAPQPVTSGPKKTPLPELRPPQPSSPSTGTTKAAPRQPAPLAAPRPAPQPVAPTSTSQILDDMVRDAEEKMAGQDARPQAMGTPVAPAKPVAPAEPVVFAKPVAPTEPAPEAASSTTAPSAALAAPSIAADSARSEESANVTEPAKPAPGPANRPVPARRPEVKQDTVRRAVAAAAAERKPMPWPGTRPRNADSELSSPYTPGHDGEWVSEPRPLGTSTRRSDDDRERAAIRVTGTGTSAAPVRQNNRNTVQLDALQADVDEKPRGFGKSFLSLFQKKSAPVPLTVPVPTATDWVGEPRPKTRRDEDLALRSPRQGASAAPEAAPAFPETPPSGIASRSNDLPVDRDEWVGAPRPKVRPAEPLNSMEPRAATTSDSAPESSAGHEVATQLVAATRSHLTRAPQPLLDPLAPVELNELSELNELGEQGKLGEPTALPESAQPKVRPDAPLEDKAPARPVRMELPAKEQSETPRSDKLSGKDRPARQSRPASKASFQPLLLPGLDEQPPQESTGNNGLELRFPAAPEEPEVIFNLTEIVTDEAEGWPVLPVSSGSGRAGQAVHFTQSETPYLNETPDQLSGFEQPLQTGLHLDPEDIPAPLPHELGGEHPLHLQATQSDEVTPQNEDTTELGRLRHVPGTPLPEHPGLELVELPEETALEEQLEQLDSLSARAQEAFMTGDIPALRATAARLAETASALGMHGLIDLARCLEEEAGDSESTASLLEIIEAAVRDEKK